MKIRWFVIFLVTGVLGSIFLYNLELKGKHQYPSVPASSPSFIHPRLKYKIFKSSGEKISPADFSAKAGAGKPTNRHVFGKKIAPAVQSTNRHVFGKKIAPAVQPNNIDKALEKLSQGQAYHNVPQKMKVGIKEIIEAGIATEITDEIKKSLLGTGEIQTIEGVRYDPSGVSMKLNFDRKEFEVIPFNSESKPIPKKNPGKWLWQVTPLQSGKKVIVIEAFVDLRIPGEKDIIRYPYPIFTAERQVEVNPIYTTKQFVLQNWKEVIGLIFGSGSLATLGAWLIDRRDKKKSEVSSST